MADRPFTLKLNDTQPALGVILKNPDNTIHDLTGATSVKLHIKLSTGDLLTWSDERLAKLAMSVGSGPTLTFVMTMVGLPTTGAVQYLWLPSIWTDPTPLTLGSHRMEYEELRGSGARFTFPNGKYDILKVGSDLGQG